MSSVVNRAKLMTKRKGTTKKKDNRAQSENTESNSKETKRKSGNPHRNRREKEGSKEQPSTAAVSGKKVKSKKKKANKATTSVDTTEVPATKIADDMLKNVAKLITSPAVQTPSQNANGQTSREEEPKKKPPVVVHPPTVPAEATSSKASGSKIVVEKQVPAVIDSSLKGQSAITPNSTLSQTDKWCGEDTARAWLDKVDFAKSKEEYDNLQKHLVNVEADCKMWKANPKLNQSIDYPVFDKNIITVEKLYVNMSQVLIKDPMQQNVIVSQLPMKGQEETFWKAVFEKKVTFMEIFVDQEPLDFFPNRAGDHVYHGTMFVNNRRVEIVSEDTHRFLIEVLPDGCSNSIICDITSIKNWKIESVYTKQGVIMKEALELITYWMLEKGEMAMVMSTHGAGRAGYFIALTVAVHQMSKMKEPSIPAIVKELREQRPKSVESLTQYASLYTSMFYFIKKKMAHGAKKTTSEDPVSKKAIQLTTAFTNALIAESNAAVGRSAMTVPK